MVELHDLPDGWETTRGSLQSYAHTLTAFARAGAPHDPRWSHVAMDPTARGFAMTPVALEDGSELLGELDLIDHLVVVTAGSDIRRMSLIDGPSPRTVGEAIHELSGRHGRAIAADPARYDDAGRQPYDADAAEAFAQAATVAIDAIGRVVAAVEGEVTGPHLWPHGFDIAAEWYSERTVDYEGSETSAQIGMGWYPAQTSYLYVNPWPFSEEFAAVPLPAGATWHRDGWEGAYLEVPGGGSIPSADVIALGSAVFDVAMPALRG